VTFTLKGTPSPGSAGCRSSTCHWAKRLAGKKHKNAQNQRIVRGSRFTVRGLRFTVGVRRLRRGAAGSSNRGQRRGPVRKAYREPAQLFSRTGTRLQTADRRPPTADRRPPNAKRQTPNATPSPRLRKRSGNRGSSFPGLRCERRSQQISLLLESAAILLR